MRPLLALLAAAIGLAGMTPARAHSCAMPVEIPIGESTTVTVGVAAEQSPLVEVDITVPEGFVLERAEDEFDWHGTLTGSVVRYRGGTLAPYACTYFNLIGRVERQATLVFPMTIRGEDGSVIEFTSDKADDMHPAQLVYAGFSPPPSSGGSGGSGNRFSGALAGVLVAVLIGVGAFTLSRRRGAARRAPQPAPRAGPRKTKRR